VTVKVYYRLQCDMCSRTSDGFSTDKDALTDRLLVDGNWTMRGFDHYCPECSAFRAAEALAKLTPPKEE
jgi:hypothetical protein